MRSVTTFKATPMEVTLIAGIAGLLATIGVLAVMFRHWHRRYSEQAIELERMRSGRTQLASKWIHQLRQARLYSALEEELCRRLSEHEGIAPTIVKKQVHQVVQSRLGDAVTDDQQTTNDRGITDQLQEVREMGFVINGDIAIEMMQAQYTGSKMTAA
jgi:hypothetical protein